MYLQAHFLNKLLKGKVRTSSHMTTYSSISGPATKLEYDQCLFNYLQLSTMKSALAPAVCSSLMKSVGTEMEGQAQGLWRI